MSSNAVNHRRIERNHKTAPYGVVTAFNLLIKIWNNVGKMISNERKNAEQVLPYFFALDSVYTLYDLIVRNTENKQVASRSI